MPTATCITCHRSWSSHPHAHCGMCHAHFSTVKNFDAHEPGPRRKNGQPSCGDPAKVTRTKRDGTVVPLLKLVEYADGPTWVGYSKTPKEATP